MSGPALAAGLSATQSPAARPVASANPLTEHDATRARTIRLTSDARQRYCDLSHSRTTVFQFHLDHSDSTTKARAGRWVTPHGVVDTPAFMPVGTRGTV